MSVAALLILVAAGLCCLLSHNYVVCVVCLSVAWLVQRAGLRRERRPAIRHRE